MGRRRGNQLLDALQAFNATYGLTRNVMMNRDLAQAAEVDQETFDQPNVVETTQGTEGMIRDSETGNYFPRMFDENGQLTEHGLSQANASEPEPVKIVEPTYQTKTTRRYRLGDKEQDTPFTTEQIGAHRLRTLSEVALRYGDPARAAQYDVLAARRHEAAGQEAIQKILAGDNPGGLERIPMPGERAAASDNPANQSSAGLQRTGQITRVSQLPGLQKKSYLEVIGPRVSEVYLRQGKINEAKAWGDFVESEQGKTYANDFARAQRLVSAGDYDAAVPVLEELYNRSYPDGRTAKLTNQGDGNFRVDILDHASGQTVGTKTMPAAEMGQLAIGALSPTKLVEFTVQQRAKRDAEAAQLDRQTTLEQLRQRAQDARDDRRDERLDKRLAQQSSDLDRRLAAKGGLSLSQQRQNEEIDVAREVIADLTPDEIRKRTAKMTDTGRENDRYDPLLARQVSLANRRKFGTDDVFDSRQARSHRSGVDAFAGRPLSEFTEDQLQRNLKLAGPEAKGKIGNELTRRAFAGDPAMKGHRLGEMTPDGFQVFDQSGKLIGHYTR